MAKYKYLRPSEPIGLEDIYVGFGTTEDEIIERLRKKNAPKEFEIIDFRQAQPDDLCIASGDGTIYPRLSPGNPNEPRLIVKLIEPAKVVKRVLLEVLGPKREIAKGELYTFDPEKPAATTQYAMSGHRGPYHPVRVKELPLDESEGPTAPAKPRC